ncbi:MAG: HGxxPAAW family protein [Micropruina sp.]|nr:hypothetical protein [Micropruina sp.]
MSQGRTPKHYHHGKSPAAWVSSAIAAIGFTLGSIAFLMGPNWSFFWVSMVIILVAPIVGGVMRKMGLGQA